MNLGEILLLLWSPTKPISELISVELLHTCTSGGVLGIWPHSSVHLFVLLQHKISIMAHKFFLIFYIKLESHIK